MALQGGSAILGGRLPGVNITAHAHHLPPAIVSAMLPGVENPGGPNQPAASAPNSIDDDPVYRQALADEQAAIDAAGSHRDAAINQALINFGAVPDFASIGASLGLSPSQIAAITGSLNPGTGALASGYTKAGNSVLAQLNQAHDNALSTLRANLAAHGTLESGATGVGVGIQNQNYEHGLNSAYQQLLSGLLGDQDSYAQAVRAAQSGLTTAAGDAYGRATAAAQANPTGTVTPPPAVTTAATSPSAATTTFSGRPSTVPAGIASALIHPKAPANAYTSGQKRFG